MTALSAPPTPYAESKSASDEQVIISWRCAAIIQLTCRFIVLRQKVISENSASSDGEGSAVGAAPG